MKKYSKFGLAFSKKFLANEGASPVIYVPSDGRPGLLPYEGYPGGRVAFQATAFDHFWKLINRVETSIPEFKGSARLTKPTDDLRKIFEFLKVHIISNLKFFDQRLFDADAGNYYMEREWRVGRDIRFRLADVVRVIVPAKCGQEFRRDFRRFRGEIIFADRPH